MPRKIEPLNGGLVTHQDPAMLEEGQLSDIRNMVYRNGAGPLERAKGRAVFGAVSAVATAVNGLRSMQFDNGDNYLVARAGTKLRTSPVADTGTFSDMATIVEGTRLEAVQYRNRYFLMTGNSIDASSIGSNVVAYLSATAAANPIQTRPHGLLPVTAAPLITTAGGGEFSQAATGYYEYWTTEVYQYTQDGAKAELESAFSSDNGVSTVFVSATSIVPTIQRPAARNLNPIPTGWRVYRSAKKEKEGDKLFPVGFMIADLGDSVAFHSDTLTLASASSFPSAFNNSTFAFAFASASSMASDNDVYASGTNGGIILAPTQQATYGYSLSSVAGSVKGIVLEVQGYISSGTAPVPITVTIGRRQSTGIFVSPLQSPTVGPTTSSKSGQISSTASATPTTLTLGSSTDRWFPTDARGLTDVDFNTASAFMAVVGFSKPNTSIGIDYVKATVHYGASVESTVQFPTVVYTFGDITSQVAKNFPPPSSSTGDLYQDSMVVNDVSKPSLVWWSFPGEPEYFPPTYFIDFETKENDRVTAIRVVNNRLIVGLADQMWRMNYLPSERDSSFDRGKAVEIISRSYGVVNAMACCNYTIDGSAEEMAFVSDKGIHTTDGFNCITRSKNLDWRLIQDLTATSSIISLLNDSENRCIRMFYRNDATANGNETYMMLVGSYDRGDIDQEQNFKWSGPVNMRNYDSGGGGTFASLESAWALSRSNGDTAFYMGYGGTVATAGAGKVYYETGTTIPSQDSTAQYTTRRIYGGGMSGEWKLDDLYGYCGSYSGAPQLIYTFKGTKTNDTGETTRGTKAITLAGQRLHRVTPQVQCEGLRITMQATASAFSQEMLIFGSQDYGLEDSGR